MAKPSRRKNKTTKNVSKKSKKILKNNVRTNRMEI